MCERVPRAPTSASKEGIPGDGRRGGPRSREWADTWFRDPDDWPPALAAAAQECLALDVPAALAWGPDFRLLYNRAHADLLEEQHPGVRGRPAWEAVSAMWPVVGPLLQRVRTTGQTGRGERAALARDTSSGRRTHWYSWTYSPVWADDRVEGVFAVVRDDTEIELAARHAHAHSSAARVTEAAEAADVLAALGELVQVLGDLPDIRFAMCHLLAADGSWNRFAQAGPELHRPTSESLVDHAERSARWPTTAGLAPCESPAAEVVRSPDPDSRGFWASWSAVASVGEETIALTAGFDPTVGRPRPHRPFLEELVRRISPDPT